jgi:hypothetical protein
MAEWHNVRCKIVWNQDTKSTQMPPWQSPSWLVLLQGLSSNLQGREVQGVDVDSPLCDPTTVSPQVSYGNRYLF